MTGTVTALTNPAARDRRSAHVRAAALHRLRERGFVVTEIAGESPAESSELAARAVADGTRIVVHRRGSEFVVVPLRLTVTRGREAIHTRHPATGRPLVLYLDEADRVEAVR